VLGVTRQALHNLVHGKAGISPAMAVRLTKTVGSTPEMWLRLQMAYDLAKCGGRKSASSLLHATRCALTDYLRP